MTEILPGFNNDSEVDSESKIAGFEIILVIFNVSLVIIQETIMIAN